MHCRDRLLLLIFAHTGSVVTHTVAPCAIVVGGKKLYDDSSQAVNAITKCARYAQWLSPHSCRVAPTIMNAYFMNVREHTIGPTSCTALLGVCRYLGNTLESRYFYLFTYFRSHFFRNTVIIKSVNVTFFLLPTKKTLYVRC